MNTSKKHNSTFLLAPDSFKGSLTALEVCDAMERGIKKILPSAQCIKTPMADGGEGTTETIIRSKNGKYVTATVTAPMGNQIEASYGLIDNGSTAVIEMAAASGLHLIDSNSLNPLIATTYGTGELIKDTIDRGVGKIILGIGGSATNDGGTGFAQALGVKFLNRNGENLPYGGGALSQLHKIDISGIDQRLSDIEIIVACDVTNILYGPAGASTVFGPQKGATPDMVTQLDNALQHYAHIIEDQLGISIADIPGSGAAGGLGAGLLAFTNASLHSGIEIIIDQTNLKEKVMQVDYIFTGEGSIDAQTSFGKTPYGIAKLAKQSEKPLIAFAGKIGDNLESLYERGFSAIFSITPYPMSIQKAIAGASENLERSVENVVRTLLISAGV